MKDISLRKQAATTGRCNIAVRRILDKERMTAAVCPGCWNSTGRRKRLLQDLKKLGVVVRYAADRAEGTYIKGAVHLSECPYR